MIKTAFVIFVCKALSLVGRLVGKGSSLPGKICLKLDPNILKKIQLPSSIIAVTGSNGKTSTVEMIAQVLKTVINAVVQKKFSLERLLGDGGMPSGHSATVTSLAAMSALTYGTGSFQFAVTTVLAIVVCHDAMGVRQETGKQAVMINEIVRSFRILSEENLQEVKLKEFVGHTPVQVIAGVLLGVINAFVMFYLVL